MATHKASGLISRAVREALGTLVSPQMCEQLIARSLAAHGLSTIPESGTEIGEWLEGSLRVEVETAVGADAADLMITQLGPIAAYAAISKPRTRDGLAPVEPTRRISTRPGRPTSTEPPAPDRAIARSGSPLQLEDDEPDRATDLRFDVGAEPDWEEQRITHANPFDRKPNPFDSGPPTGMYAQKELSFSPTPPANGNHAPPTSAPPVVTLPPAKLVPGPTSDRDLLSTTRPPIPEPISLEIASNLPQVLTATADRSDLDALRRYLSSSASVVHIPDLVGLLDALEDPALVEPIVLIDCQRPTVHISSVAAIGEDLPKGTTVVLWGADDSTWSQIDRERSPACRWVRCSREATTDDVGSLCSMLLG